MATIFKSLLAGDITATRTALYEAIPLTGSIISGTYGAFGSESNIKTYSHGMFESVYDYAYLSSSANHIFDLTVGFSPRSALSHSSPGTQQEKKINIYNQMAQTLMGNDATGSILEFDQDGNILAGGTKMRECIFINFARLLTKDEIKKGSFTISFGRTTAFGSANASYLTITDAGAANDYKVNSPVGEYGILSASVGEAAGSNLNAGCGLIFYQAGIAVITASIFQGAPTGAIAANALMTAQGHNISQLMTGSSIKTISDAFRHRWYDCSYNNTTELNSTIYFCRINHNDFNYSSNPTYLSSSKIVVKNNSLDQPVAYFNTICLCAPDGAIMATAKTSENLKKTSDSSLNIRVRLDF